MTLNPYFQVPSHTKALVVKQSPPDRKPLYHDAVLEDQPLPQLMPGQVLVKINAAAFNHRDVSKHSIIIYEYC